MGSIASMKSLLGLVDPLRDVPGKHLEVPGLADLAVGIGHHPGRHQHLPTGWGHLAAEDCVRTVHFWCTSGFELIEIEKHFNCDNFTM